jgi:GTP-binding protein Era
VTASPPHRAGYVAIAGRPNAGKSTLLNRLLGMPIAAVSRRPQTTRNRLLGMYNRDDVQIVFVDTPGIHEAHSLLNRRMVETALSATAETDVLVLLADARRESPDEELIATLDPSRRPTVLALNKVDRVEKTALLPRIAAWSAAAPWAAIVPISALDGDGVGELIGEVSKRLPESPPYFPKDQVTDASERFIVSEIVREKLFATLDQELPYATAVEIERFVEDDGKGRARIEARIWVERESQKPIVIGKGGATVKRIGSLARVDIERLLDRPVFLGLTVSVKADWTRDRRSMERLGGFVGTGGAGEGG